MTSTLRIAERLAQPRDVDLDRLDRARRHVLAPQRDRQAFRAHRLIGVQREHREHGARSGAAELHRAAVGADLERTKDPELQHSLRDVIPGAARQSTARAGTAGAGRPGRRIRRRGAAWRSLNSGGHRPTTMIGHIHADA